MSYWDKEKRSVAFTLRLTESEVAAIVELQRELGASRGIYARKHSMVRRFARLMLMSAVRERAKAAAKETTGAAAKETPAIAAGKLERAE